MNAINQTDVAGEIRPANRGPLTGIKVLDLTAVVLGPVATQVLADYGADVIKVEPPEGDLMRANGISRTSGMSSTFMNINRNKSSVCIDLKSEQGKARLCQLIAQSDVLVHNIRVKAMERLGFGYAEVAKINPTIIYCAATGFGEGGAFAGQPAFDDIIQGACGLAHLVGHESGVPEYPPTLLADKIAGLATANAILGALVYKARTGEGQYVEVPMFETMVAFTMTEHLGGQGFKPPIGDAGYARLLKGGRKPSPTKDGYIALLPYTEQHWRAFFHHFGRGEFIDQFNISNRIERNKNIQAIYAELRNITRQYSTRELMAVCREMDIPVAEMYSIHTIQTHPHVQSTGLFKTMVHPTEGEVVTTRPTALFSKSPCSIYKPAPNLGEDSERVLGAGH
ncbi:CoA transferase [Alicycliphilus denitrificans]|uniref:CaiB/BaiF CoA transferase family protein n=1 Tax=Alicycliphilus denitrificans TaxID=179636 RepID=UPI00095CABEB|nr:CoA transferase [Alicycliphilus denitrificans]MBN9575321.1 CoA transferase [Alicycliphilus denitrificans]OJW93098.1 MAG: CoA transferase [Alicycliphilus sp. 69-12]BCN37066.1 CoA transferase [Alicycliphilus denitrificans]HRP21144.1 CoA transferase [Alicycliphilus sp.]